VSDASSLSTRFSRRALRAVFFWAFVFIRNLYPVAAWNVMMAGGDLERGRSYCILRGETFSGQTSTSPHQIDERALQSHLDHGQRDHRQSKLQTQIDSSRKRRDAAAVWRARELPAGARVPDLLKAWGDLYNKRQPASSPERLKAIRLDMYRWESGRYSDYDKFVESWRKELNKSRRSPQRVCPRRRAFHCARHVSDLNSLHFFLSPRFAAADDSSAHWRMKFLPWSFYDQLQTPAE
jgi:hypothetical protein